MVTPRLSDRADRVYAVEGQHASAFGHGPAAQVDGDAASW
jgi:hypothetical protein